MDVDGAGEPARRACLDARARARREGGAHRSRGGARRSRGGGAHRSSGGGWVYPGAAAQGGAARGRAAEGGVAAA